MQDGRSISRSAAAGRRRSGSSHRAFSTWLSIGDLVPREQAPRGEAEAVSLVKDDFLATLSHELRMPLTAILGWASVIARGRASETQPARATQAIERKRSCCQTCRRIAAVVDHRDAHPSTRVKAACGQRSWV
jgi:signal transduction histidine kinase